MTSIGAIAATSARSLAATAQPASLDLLDFLYAQHVTQLAVCELLAKLALDPHNVTAPHDAAAIVDCFAEWLPLHDAIEEEQLFGVVGQRSLPSDDIDGMLAQLKLGHQESRSLADELMEGLHDIATGRRLGDPDGFRATAIALCSHHRAMVQWEDDVLYPFIRERLDIGDLSELATAIARGREAAQLEPWPWTMAESFDAGGWTADPIGIGNDGRLPPRRKRH
jgi:hemerythrin-like domain-containing protein